MKAPADRQPDLAVVTGGASGIGLALCYALGRRGAAVLVADRDEAALSTAVGSLTTAGVTAFGQTVDLRDANGVQALADRARQLGPIRYLCANAGVSTAGTSIWETPANEVGFVLDVNLGGLLRCLRSFIPILLDQSGTSAVIVTASMAGLVTTPSSGAYSASKAAVIAATKALRADLQSVRDDIHVALLCPGMVGTNLQRTSADLQRAAGGGTPVNVEEYHAALNQLGIAPSAVADWVLGALDGGQFWVLPPKEDLFSTMLQSEVADLLAGLGCER